MDGKSGIIEAGSARIPLMADGSVHTVVVVLGR
jgi:hypothetical protein